jgi:hypothetical protein
MSNIQELQRIKYEYIKKRIDNLPGYCFGYEEGERYPKLRCTDPIYNDASRLYTLALERLVSTNDSDEAKIQAVKQIFQLS